MSTDCHDTGDYMQTDTYAGCHCDTTRRAATSLDGWSLYCDKCVICGRYGHHRQMPGTSYSGGFCEYHFLLLDRASDRDVRSALFRTKREPVNTARLLCGQDMGNKYYERKRDAFMREHHSVDFFDDLFNYIDNPVRPTLGAVMKHLPETLPYDENLKLKASLVARYMPCKKNVAGS